MNRARSFGVLLFLAAAPARASLVPVRTWTPPAVPPIVAGPVDLSPQLLPPGAQGLRNTCSVFAAAGLGEFLWKSVAHEDFKISEQHLYYSAKHDYTGAPEHRVYKTIDGLPGYVAVKALSGGVVPADAWPYDSGSRQEGETTLERFTGRPPEGLETAYRDDYRFTPIRIPRESIGDFILWEKKPVVFNVMWYFDAADNATGILRAPTDAERQACLESGQGCGGHVVLLVGFDPETREYIFRNSWGPRWGRGGYGRMPESYITQDCELCHHLARRDGLPKSTQRMLDNAVHGWSGNLSERSRRSRRRTGLSGRE